CSWRIGGSSGAVSGDIAVAAADRTVGVGHAIGSPTKIWIGADRRAATRYGRPAHSGRDIVGRAAADYVRTDRTRLVAHATCAPCLYLQRLIVGSARNCRSSECISALLEIASIVRSVIGVVVGGASPRGAIPLCNLVGDTGNARQQLRRRQI